MSSSSSRRTPLSDSSISIRKHRNFPSRKSNVPHTKKGKNHKKIEKMRRKAKNTKEKRHRRDLTAGIADSVSSVHPDCVVQDMDEKEFREGNKRAARCFDVWYDNLVSDMRRIKLDRYYDGDYFDRRRISRLKDEIYHYYHSKEDAVEYFLPREYDTKFLVFMTYSDDALLNECYNYY